jgi:hypothetical protein
MEFSMRVIASLAAVAASVSLVVACGGGGGGGTPQTTSYVSSAALGEVIRYQVNLSTLSYDYEVLFSRFGCTDANAACRTGNGTLVLQQDGTYQPTGSPSTRVFLANNGVLLGTFKLRDDIPATPIMGFDASNLVTSFTPMDLLFAGMTCPTKGEVNVAQCNTVWGHIKTSEGVDNSTQNFTLCRRGDLDATCNDQTTGTMQYTGQNGIWLLRTNSAILGYMAKVQSINGPVIGFLDFDNADFGYGHAKVSTKVRLTSELIQQQAPGTWVLANESGQMDFFNVNSDGELDNGNPVTWNQPIDGLATIDDPNSPYISLQTGPGMFTLINNIQGTESFEPKYFIGVKVSDL